MALWVDLTETPSSLTGQDHRFVRVKTDESGLELVRLLDSFNTGPHSGIIDAGALVDRPSAGVEKRYYWAIDVAQLFFDDGVTWTKVSVANHNDLDGKGVADHHQPSPTTTQGDIIRHGSPEEGDVDERLACATAGALVGGNGTDVVSTVPDRTVILTARGGAPRKSNPCGRATLFETSSNLVNYTALPFDKDTDEYAVWDFAMPSNYNGGDLNATFYWTTSGGSAAQTVLWGIQMNTLADNDALDTAFGTADTQSDTFIANGDVHISTEKTGVTPTGTGSGGADTHVQVYRDVSGDDLGADALLLKVLLTYTTNAISD